MYPGSSAQALDLGLAQGKAKDPWAQAKDRSVQAMALGLEPEREQAQVRGLAAYRSSPRHSRHRRNLRVQRSCT